MTPADLYALAGLVIIAPHLPKTLSWFGLAYFIYLTLSSM